MRIALLGGSFDPPHLAHIQIIEHLLQQKKYDEIWISPSFKNPLKETTTPFAKRLKMCHLAFDQLGEKVKVIDLEKKLSGYTIDLIRYLLKKFPDLKITFIAGSDLNNGLNRWKESEHLQKLIDFEFVPRYPDPETPFLPVSSTEIRQMAKKGLPLRDQVPEEVEKYIREQHLYD